MLAAAGQLGISAFVLTVLVSGLELENLVAGVAADLKGLPDAAAGTFLGGTTFLALAVSGLAALITPLQPRLPRRTYAWAATAPLPLVALAADGHVSRVDGGALVAWSVVALVAIVRMPGVVSEQPPAVRRRLALTRLAAGLGVLTVGGEVLGEGIQRVVRGFGVSEALLGNTAVAAAVEAEEVARVVTPGRRGRGDLALANVVGTIVHFAAFNAGVIALVRPLELGSATLHLHLPVAAASAALLALLAATRPTLGRAEGALLVVCYAGYVAAAVLI